MNFLIVLAILFATSEGCQLPDELVGQWDSSLAGWNNLKVSSANIHAIPTDKEAYDFSCFLKNGTTYVLRSPELEVGDLLQYHYYTCLDIVPAGNNPDLVFFRIRAEDNPKHDYKPFTTIQTSENATMDRICNKPATDMPMNYTFFLRKGYEESLGDETCPRSLQAVFSANFTGNYEERCPDDFELNGCAHSHLTFNYTDCDGGSTNYTCLASLEKDDVTYTVITLQQDQGQDIWLEANTSQPNNYQFACLAQQQGDGVDGSVMRITKSAGTCGAVVSMDMTAEETVSCRSQNPKTSTSTTGSGSTGNVSHTPHPSTQGPGTGGGEQGGGGSGDGNSCSAASWGILSLLLPAVVTVLAAVKL